MPSASLRKSAPQARARQSSVFKAVVASLAGFTAVAAIAAVAAVVGSRTTAPTAPTPAAPAVVNAERTTSIVVASPNHDDCQRYQVDNVTGGVKETGMGECGKGGSGQGTRVQAIAKGFRSR